MSSRLGFRAAQQTFRQSVFRPQTTANARFAQRRAQSTAANASEAVKNEGGFSKIWNSPVGPKTVHFWAPVMKWGLVLAGASDFTRPADQLSLSQNAALTATGLIWTRWCFVIRPKNVFLASVNFLVFVVGATQVTRVFLYQRSLKGNSVAEEVKESVKEGAAEIENVAKNPQIIKDSVEKSRQ